MEDKEYIENLEAVLIDVIPSDWDESDISYFCNLSIDRAIEVNNFLEEVRKNYNIKHGINNED